MRPRQLHRPDHTLAPPAQPAVPIVNRAAARLVLVTRGVDTAYRRFEGVRSTLFAALLSNATLDRFNDIAYGSNDVYRRGSKRFWDHLLPAEEAVWDDALPAPPARVLVGGAGGGREVAALVERGYEVVAFEPSLALVENLAASGLESTWVYSGAYEELPFVRTVPCGQRVDLRRLRPFDAGLLGFGSYSHLRREEDRVAALRAFGELTGGPVIVGFLGVRPEGSQPNTRRARLHRKLPRREGRELDDRFSVYLGFHHRVSRSEFEVTARSAGVDVITAGFDERDRWPHAVIRCTQGRVAEQPGGDVHEPRERTVPVTRRAVVRLVIATRGVDIAYSAFERARSDLLAGLLSDATLDRINDVVYGLNDSFRHGSVRFDASLFPWEEALLRDVFPPPPARVLVGGAGGGREVSALAERGYEIVAFEPAAALVESLAAWRLERTLVYRGAYEELPYVRTVAGGERVDLRGLGPFDAALLGWGSFSHLRREEHRIATLRAFGELTGGPVVASFVGLGLEASDQDMRGVRLLRRLPRRKGRSPGDGFSLLMGFYHPPNRAEFEATVRLAGMDLEQAVFEGRDTAVWPHVVVRRRRPPVGARNAGL